MAPADRTLPAFLAAAAERWGDREAVVWGDVRWTYRDLAREAARVADGLRALGVGKGDPVGVLLPNWPEFFATVFGATALGAVAVCLNTMATEPELAFALDHARVRWLVYTPAFLRHDYERSLASFGVDRAPAERSAARDLVARVALVRAGEVPDGARDYRSLGSSPADGAARLRELDAASPDQPAVIFFTSGSTAKPKGVVHAHQALVHQAFVASDAFGLAPEDRSWGCLPMFFAGGFVIIALITFATGGATVLQDHFVAEEALDLFERERVTFYAGWQLAPALVDHPSFAGRSLALRKGIFTTSPAAPKLLRPDHVSVGAYGLSETATVVCLARSDDPPELRQRGFGRPLPGVELRVIDPETGGQRARGEVGEILVRGPSLMLGYLGIPPSQTFTPDGFFRTGDYGRVDESGTLLFDGRLKEVIKTAGVNVAAAEVEACLEAAAGVAAAYVVPVAHAVRGENVAAFVVPKPGATIERDALVAHCKRELASYKVPRHLFVLPAADVPRTGTQKVDKPRLRREAAELAGGDRDLLAS
ncbi:MAG TPA: class I adenylate-forming enzyme family protein [Candidatus Binatia bacterium]|nr:class I adenylate-forming enzyme family protein [Candidatus Binatia bacterium]